MSERLLLISVPADRAEAVFSACQGFEPMDLHMHDAPEDADRRVVQATVKASRRQDALDALQEALEGAEGWRINVLALEATLPDPREKDPDAEDAAAQESREELYKAVSQQARADLRFAVFVALSAVVAAFGMLLDSVAVVIGAMAIAPLLGPNLGFALGASLGDRALMLSALRSAALGLALAAAAGAAVGVALGLGAVPGAAEMLGSPELLSRARPGFDGMVIALASGAAATLSVSSGAAAALVGVMVAVALLPPAVAAGLLAGAGDSSAAGGAAMLLAINVVCVNLSAQLTLWVVGIRARTWRDEAQARVARRVGAAVWLTLLAALIALLIRAGPFAVPPS